MIDFRTVQIGLVGAGLSVMMGCSAPLVQSSSAMPTMQQSLPIEAEMRLGGKTIQLEVARTPQQQAIGLMNRKSLASDRGMIFLFNPPRVTQFWMKNTLIPLDMVFVRSGVVKSIQESAPPCVADPCPTYGSPTEVIDQVIELRGGRAKELGLKVGDRIRVNFRKPNS